MASSSEVGHAKNVSNLETMLSYCTGYGAVYNPSNSDLLLSDLTTLHTDSKASVKLVKTTETPFNDCSFKNKTIYSTVYITDKSALKAKVTFNRCIIEQTNPRGSLITLSTDMNTLQNLMTFGGINFNDCTINHNSNTNFMNFTDNSNTGKGIRDVNGTMTVNNPFGAKYNLGNIQQNVNLAITQNVTNATTISISQPSVLAKTVHGNNLVVSALANDIDVGTGNGAGILKVIFEVQYNNTKVFTTEVLSAPYTINIPTTGWQKGIYLVKAIAVSNFLETKNLVVVPVEIEAAVIPLSIATNNLITKLNIYPNPFSNTINISASENIASLKIMSLSGETIISKNVNQNSYVLTTNELTKGFYILEVVYEDGIKENVKLLKE